MATTIDPPVDSTYDSRSMSGPSGDKTPQTEQIEIYGADEEMLIRLFRTKMKYALAEAGYDRDAQNIVSELVERNVISCGIALSGNYPVQGDLFEAASIQTQLEDLMSGGFNVNSNEPVLLILIDGIHNPSHNAVQAIREASCAALRDTFHVYPVRVYVACYPDDTGRRTNSRNGFGLALLNVVNTDIGGPGMIQLLDDQVYPPDWERMVVSTEAWNRTDLLWQNEKQMTSELARENAAVALEISDLDHGMQHHTQNDSVVVANMSEDPTMGNDDDDDDVDVQSEKEISRRTSISEQPVVVEHPALTEMLAREANRPPVQHPSWEHATGGDSLLDLIRMQASTIEHSDAETDPVEVEAGIASSKVLSDADSESGFHLV